MIFFLCLFRTVGLQKFSSEAIFAVPQGRMLEDSSPDDGFEGEVFPISKPLPAPLLLEMWFVFS